MKPSNPGLQHAKVWTAATLVKSINAIVVHFSPTRPGMVRQHKVGRIEQETVVITALMHSTHDLTVLSTQVAIMCI